MSATTDSRQFVPSRPQPGRATLTDRIGIILASAAIIAVVALLVLTVTTALEWRARPFVGMLFTRAMVADATIPNTPDDWPARVAGLRPGDHIIAFNGAALAPSQTDYALASRNFQQNLQLMRIGEPVTLTFTRPAENGDVPIVALETCAAPVDGLARCTVSFNLAPFPDGDFLSLFIVPFVTGLVAFGIGAALFLTRNAVLASRLAAGAMVIFSAFCFTYFDLNTTQSFSRVWLISAILTGAVVVQLGLVFPIPLMALQRRPGLRLIPLVVGAVIAVLAILVHEKAPTPRGVQAALWVGPAVAIGSNLFFVALMVRRRRQASTALLRDQANTLMLGMALGSTLALIWLVNLIIRSTTGVAPLLLNSQPGLPIQLLPLLSIAYAVQRGRVRDGDRVVSDAITYTIMLGAVLFGYVLLVLAASLAFGSAAAANNPIIIALAVFLIALGFSPLRAWLQTRIDRLFSRQRVNLSEALETFTRRLASIGEVDQIGAAVRQHIENTLAPSQSYLFLPGPDGQFQAEGTDILFAPSSPLIEALGANQGVITLNPGLVWHEAAVAERARLHLLGAQVIAGMSDSDGAVLGMVVLAAPRAATPSYNYEALRHLENLLSAVGVAFERAAVVDTLEKRVAELNAFSQISQVVNFTLDLDDQLELLYAQTTRLIDASHFYLTLVDRDANELYHAFFIENDERLRENEGRRWRIGTDFFSQVVRTSQPIVLANYAEAAISQGAGLVVEDRQLRAWSAVPLIAGDNTIGVLAVGSANAAQTFGLETAKVLRDIALLAATSIDKARLFNETNQRARQFAALNDIAGEIVAAEKDVDRLLDLITNRVVDLLDAEAGSLLLVTDDGTSDLEFKVVSGGGGKGLIGVRVPAGRGLVGEVAATARPVMVNDATRDPRWGGEFAKGTFRTNSVLAVPLLTQSRVIGVLEVLNKKQDGSFNADDVTLLTAFGAQAAVAIENARLFQMTDLQLSQRVSELETMERIDVELNRSLDLARISQITVQSAVETTGAAAGLLALISGEPPALHVIMKQGYSEADKPEGAEGDRYPLDRGIVARVLRSRQPELVYDVRLDPNYVPSLRGALSQATVPIISGNLVIGMLVIETDREPRLRLADMPFLQRLIEHASIAIANAQLYAQVERANNSKNEFVSFVAHELKNPLAAVQGWTDIMIKGMAGPVSDMQQNTLRTIRSNADRLNTIVSDLNDVTKLETNNLKLTFGKVGIDYIIEETMRVLEGRIIDKGQRLIMEISPSLPPLRADGDRLIQVLTNLVSNAHKYSPADTTITISARLNELLSDARGKLIGPQVQVTVRDQGIGMSKDDVKRLFTPYFRSENPLAKEQPGTGLGLTITRGIIERHGGLIWVESELGVGTAFHFSIPPVAETQPA